MGRCSYSHRLTTDECKSISTKFLRRYNYFSDDFRWGRLSWSRNGQKRGGIGFVVSTVEGDEYIQFQYIQTDRNTGEKTELDYKVQLTWTPCYFGGRRWWFICPLIVKGQHCGRRVGVLYLGGGKYFGCRHCYNLTYESSKESHKFDGLFRKVGIPPKAINDLLRRSRIERER